MILSVLVVLLTILRDLFGNVYGFVAAKRLHSAMFKSVLRAPMSFFQDTPTGRIINRFSKDMSEIDKELIWQLINTFVPVLGVVGNFAMVGGIAYFAMLAFLPAFWLYYLLWKYYNKALRSLRFFWFLCLAAFRVHGKPLMCGGLLRCRSETSPRTCGKPDRDFFFIREFLKIVVRSNGWFLLVCRGLTTSRGSAILVTFTRTIEGLVLKGDLHENSCLHDPHILY